MRLLVLPEVAVVGGDVRGRLGPGNVKFTSVANCGQSSQYCSPKARSSSTLRLLIRFLFSTQLGHPSSSQSTLHAQACTYSCLSKNVKTTLFYVRVLRRVCCTTFLRYFLPAFSAHLRCKFSSARLSYTPHCHTHPIKVSCERLSHTVKCREGL